MIGNHMVPNVGTGKREYLFNAENLLTYLNYRQHSCDLPGYEQGILEMKHYILVEIERLKDG